MKIFIVTKEVRENGIIVKQKIRGITDSETILNCSQDDLYYIYDDTNLSVYELQLSNYDSKKVTGFNSMDQIKRYIASCATHSIEAPFYFYKSYITDVKCIYNAWGINRFFMDTGFTFKYKGISFFLYNYFEKNTAVRATHYIIRIKENTK
jgi:hypothetical protein